MDQFWVLLGLNFFHVRVDGEEPKDCSKNCITIIAIINASQKTGEGISINNIFWTKIVTKENGIVTRTMLMLEHISARADLKVRTQNVTNFYPFLFKDYRKSQG